MTVDLSKIGYGSVFAADTDGIQLSKIGYGSLFNHSPADGIILSKLGYGVIVNIGVIAIWPETVPDDSEVYPVDHVIKVLSPDFVDGGDEVYPPSFEFLFIIADRERNPYSAHVPSIDLVDFQAEQQRILRQQHNKTQAGDTTFDYGLLLKSYPNQEFTLGSLGRFYHDDYGLILARYVQFTQMINTAAQGVPVGRLANTDDEVNWKVTNDFSKSGRDLVMGMIFIADAPADDTFGWCVTHGPNPAFCRADTSGIPLQNDPYSWSGTGFVSLGARGRVVARRWGRAFDSKLAPGQIFIALEGLSPADLVFAIEEANAELIAQVDDIDGRVTTNTTGIAALRSDVTALQSYDTYLLGRINAEETARIRDIASIRSLLGSATNWNAAILAGDNLVRAEFAAADDEIRALAVNAQLTADNALAAAGALDATYVMGQLSSLNASIITINSNLINFVVDYPTPADNQVLVSVTAAGPDGGIKTTWVGRDYQMVTLFDVDVSTPQTNLQGLLWDSGSSTWKPQDVVLPSRQIVAGTGMSGGGDLSADRTLSIDTSAEAERIRDVIGAALVAGTDITITVNDAGDTITITSTAGGGVSSGRQIISGGGLTGGGDLSADRTLAVGAGTGIIVNADDVAIDTSAEAERIRDTIGSALVAGANIVITVNDAGDTITIDASGGTGGGTGTVVGTAVAASNVIDLSGLTLTGYDLINLDLSGITLSAAGTISLQFYIAGSLVTSGYWWIARNQSTSGTDNATQSASAASIFLTGNNASYNYGNVANNSFGGKLTLAQPAGSLFKSIDGMVTYKGASNWITSKATGSLENTGAITGFKLISSVNITAGRMTVMGYGH